MEGDWKLIHFDLTGKNELYNLKADPEEANDLSAVHPERADRLAKKLEVHLRASGAQRMRPNPNWDPKRSQGKIRNFGVNYSVGGETYRQVKEPLPEWFSEAGAE